MSKDTGISIFISYAYEDDDLYQKLKKHLILLERQNIIKVWYDRAIMAGTDWTTDRDSRLRTAHLILLLISADFLASDYCDSFEMKEALARQERGEATILPILLRPVDWHQAPFGHIKALPDDGVPVAMWRNRDEAFVNITNGIRVTIEENGISPSRATFTPETPTTDIPLWPFNIPDEPYYLLPKREQNLNQMLSMLLEQQEHRILVISGLGGLGKTSIGAELARRACKSGQFKGIVGDSAKQEYLIGGEIILFRDSTLNLGHFLDEIAKQIKHPEIRTLKEEAKLRALAEFFRQHSYLIIVDNLETFDDVKTAVFHFSRMVGRSRVIITSREPVEHSFVSSRRLSGLDLEDSLFFLQKEIERMDNRQLRQVPEEQFIEIHEATGGAPLAMKLVAAQTMSLDLALVLKQLHSAENQKNQLYTFIFRQSWEHLSLIAQAILIYIGKTVSTTISWQELVDEQFTETEEELQEAIKQLLMYSLLDMTSGDQIRYGIHQLTRQFVVSDLPGLWGLI